tara:strand:- start:245 stop:475 length:231 start_codon:yes stop_codon:yes gene_type:complete
MGLYSNIQAKKKRIAAGSGETMRSVGDKGAPTAKNFKDAAKTAKPKKMSKGGLAESRIAKGCGAVMSHKRKKTKFF